MLPHKLIFWSCKVTKVPKIECKDQLGTPRGESDVQIAGYFFASDIRKDNQNCIE